MSTARGHRPEPPEAVLFDLDGVVTDTAAVHRRAWAAVFRDFLAGRVPAVAPYTDRDYLEYIDGKPRFDGVRSLLGSRGIVLPEGDPDAVDTESVHGLGNLKNQEFGRVLENEGVRAFEGSVGLIDDLIAGGVPVAVVSSSRNANAVLRAAGLADRFPLVVDGVLAAQRGLAGKPAPDTFVYAAKELGADPAHSIVAEDALSGAAAGRAGGFWVVGVDRGEGADALRAAGADEVVTDLGQLRATR